MKQSEIQELATYYKGELYGEVRAEQAIDLTYKNDTFKVPWIKEPYKVRRLGKGARLINAPIEHIITQNPQAFRDYTLEQNKDAALRVNAVCNDWLIIMKHQNPNPFRDHCKNNNLYGEVWLQILHNEKWLKGEKKGLPFLALLPDPMIVFASPNEDENGVPDHYILQYERLPWILAQRYPGWSKAKDTSVEHLREKLKFTYYMDKKQIYAEIDGEVVLDKKNPYNKVNIVHKLSGYGTSSPTGEMKDRIVGRLRDVRHILERKTSIISDIDSSFHLFANRNVEFDITSPEVDPAAVDVAIGKYEIGTGMAYVSPFGVQVKKPEEFLPEDAFFRYAASIDMELEREDPLVMAGMPMGEGGRQQDMVYESARRRYEYLAEAAELAYSTGLGMALEMCEKIPGMLPDELKKGDIKKNYQIRVELKAPDPIAADRKATLGSRLYQSGEIDLRTNLVEYQGKTPEKAEMIIALMMADKAMYTPETIAVLGMTAAQKMGMEEEIAAARAVAQGGAPGGQGRPGEVETPLGREQVDMSLAGRGVRTPPTPFTRGT